MEIYVISSIYLKLQEDISALYKNWLETLKEQEVIKKPKVITRNYPLLTQQELQINTNGYLNFIEELSKVVEDYKPELAQDLEKVKSILNDEILNKWFKEVIAVNTHYFADFAREHQIPNWLPFFMAEHAIHPYLQKAAQELSEDIPKQGHKGACPVCGEPPRLAVINKDRKKEITCPRCHFAWVEKKISCAYCGMEEQGQVVILRVEEDESAEIFVCKSCKDYTKVIDTRKLLKVISPELLDLKSIHLDYVAQENGYGEPKFNKTH